MERKINFKVLIVESKVKGISYGVNLAENISKIGLNVKAFPDDRVNEMVGECTFVLLSTDAIIPDGSIINGTPSLKLTVEAKASLYM